VKLERKSLTLEDFLSNLNIDDLETKFKQKKMGGGMHATSQAEGSEDGGDDYEK
jgi:hypothetical protein